MEQQSDRLTRLKAFIDRNGHLPSRSVRGRGDSELAVFVNHMITSGPGFTRPAARAKYVTFAAMCDGVPSARDHQWNTQFQASLRFCQLNGFRPIRQSHNPAGFRLGQWLRIQVDLLDSDDLETERADRLQQILVYPTYGDFRFEKNAQTAARIIGEHGRVPVNVDRQAYAWLRNAQVSLEAGRLSQKQRDQFSAILALIPEEQQSLAA